MQEKHLQNKLYREKHYLHFSNLLEIFLGPNQNWKNKFRELETDFERICFLLRSIQNYSGGLKRSFTILEGLQNLKSIEMLYGKNDRISEIHRLTTTSMNLVGKFDYVLFHATSAVFFADSTEQKAMAFARRCNILFNLNLINEAIRDGEFSHAVSSQLTS